MPWDGVERRRKKRYGVKDAIVRYKKAGLFSFISASSPKYLLLNVSELGLSFISKEQLAEGQGLVLTVTAPRVHGTIHARGRVIWVKKSDNQEAYRIGVEFASVRGRSRDLLKSLLDSAVVDSVEISTRVYLKELDKL